jgi:hypothetical protein
MEITLVIVGGIIVLTLVAVVGDVVGKAVKARGGSDPKTVRDLARRVEDLERLSLEREDRIRRLEADVAFANRLLEDRHSK